jgi:hypothetical protein
MRVGFLRFSLAAAVSVVAVGALVAPATAANVHFVGTPTFTDNGTTLSASGKLAGLGNKDITVTITAQGVASTECRNPSGKVVPGINKKLTTVGTVTILASEFDKNGNVVFDVTTAEPAALTAKEAGCPNNNWTARVTDIDFSSATVTVVQGNRTVLTKTFTGL